MTLSLTREQARQLDQQAMLEFGVPGVVLMENAGRGMAELLMRLGVQGRVVVVAGKGNNGGDGFVIARHLDLAEVEVRVLLCCRRDELRGDAAINARIAERAGLSIREVGLDPFEDASFRAELDASTWIVDALFGSGLQGLVRAPFSRIIELMNAASARRFAVDIPSGLDADTGEPLGVALQADHTATVVAPKVGFLIPGAAVWLGQVHVVSMGAPRCLLQRIVRCET